MTVAGQSLSVAFIVALAVAWSVALIVLAVVFILAARDKRNDDRNHKH